MPRTFAWSTNSRTLIAAAGWAFCAVFFFYAFILRVSPAVMVDDLMREFAVGAAILGNLSAVYLYVYAGLQIPLGMLIDRYGLRYIIAAACFLCAFGAWTFAQAETAEQAYLGRAMIGAGAAFSFVSALNMAAQWFPTRFAVLAGWAQMMGSAGGFAGQAPLGLVIAAIGWRDANALLAFAGGALAIALFFTVGNPRRTHAGARVSVWKGLKVVAANRQTWLASVGAAGMTGTLLAFGGLWGVPYLMVARGLSKPEAAGLISLGFIGWAVSAPIIGWASDRMGRRRPLILLGAATATVTTAMLVFWASMPSVLLIPVLLLQGALSSSMILCFAVTQESNPPEYSGAALGLINTFAVGGGAILQPAAGLILDMLWDGTLVNGARSYSAGDFQAGLAILPVSCAISFAAALLLSEPKTRAPRT